MHVLRRGIALIAFAAVVLLPLLARSQDGGDGSVARSIDDKLFFVRHFDRCYEQLEADAKARRAEHPDAADVAEAHRRVLVAWAASLDRRGQREDALDRLAPVLADGSGTGTWREAAALAAGLEASLAGELGPDRDADAIARYDRALALYRKLGDDASAHRVLGMLFDLRSREGLKAYRAEDFDRAFDLLTKIEREFEGGVPPGAAADALRFLRERTGSLAVELMPVAADGTPVSGGARLVLTPKGSGKAKEVAVRKRLRWIAGSYELSIRLPGESAPLLTLPLPLTPAGATVRIPEKVPPGMVYVPPGGGVRAFFIDRTEVSIRDFSRFERVSGSPNLPAQNISFARAKAYAASVKKQLPTPEQWARAAFGDDGRKYPWGNQPPRGRCNIGTGRAEPVDAYPTGASPFGVLNMAGNVWEWLRTGYAIGGGFRIGVLQATPENWTRAADFLRDAKPDNSLWEATSSSEFQRKYSGYRVYSGNLVEVGLRCVIEL